MHKLHGAVLVQPELVTVTVTFLVGAVSTVFSL